MSTGLGTSIAVPSIPLFLQGAHGTIGGHLMPKHRMSQHEAELKVDEPLARNRLVTLNTRGRSSICSAIIHSHRRYGGVTMVCLRRLDGEGRCGMNLAKKG